MPCTVLLDDEVVFGRVDDINNCSRMHGGLVANETFHVAINCYTKSRKGNRGILRGTLYTRLYKAVLLVLNSKVVYSETN